ncbi:MAG: phasin family protein [Cyanophyceae cyanobacterium]|mgnify:CR=1 FL=1
MQNFGDLAQKALYLGIGIASYAGEKANEAFNDVRRQAQEMADEMVARGEMSAEEAKKMVEDAVQQAQQAMPNAETPKPEGTQNSGPRRINVIDITDEDESNGATGNDVQTMRDQVQALEEELQRLKRES